MINKLPLFTRFLCLFLCLVTAVDSTAQHTSVIGKAWAGNSVNTVVFRHNSVVSYGNEQYAAYYDSTGFLVLAKRSLNSDTWQVQQTPYKGNIRDAHNNISMMLDGAGYLHVAWDHHNNQLNYCKSVAPGSLQLTQRLQMTGEQEASVTYPEFYRRDQHHLFFLYRDGGSGRGNLVLNRYDTRTGKWERLHSNLIDGEGRRSAYWQACVDHKGDFYISWVWRENPDVSSNHDLCYARSSDGGVTWRKSNGQIYQMPINAANAEYIVRIPQKSSLINSTAMCTSQWAKPHIVTYWTAAGDSIPQYRLVFFDGKAWRVRQISDRKTPFSLGGGGTKRIPISRPQVMTQGKRVFVVFRDAERGNRVSLAYTNDITAKTKWKTIDLTTTSVGQWEPSYDTELWLNKQILHLYVQYAGQGDGERTENVPAQPVSVLEYKIPPHKNAYVPGW